MVVTLISYFVITLAITFVVTMVTLGVNFIGLIMLAVNLVK